MKSTQSVSPPSRSSPKKPSMPSVHGSTTVTLALPDTKSTAAVIVALPIAADVAASGGVLASNESVTRFPGEGRRRHGVAVRVRCAGGQTKRVADGLAEDHQRVQHQVTPPSRSPLEPPSASALAEQGTDVSWIVALPFATAVTCPEAFTRATVVSLDAQVNSAGVATGWHVRVYQHRRHVKVCLRQPPVRAGSGPHLERCCRLVHRHRLVSRCRLHCGRRSSRFRSHPALPAPPAPTVATASALLVQVTQPAGMGCPFKVPQRRSQAHGVAQRQQRDRGRAHGDGGRHRSRARLARHRARQGEDLFKADRPARRWSTDGAGRELRSLNRFIELLLFLSWLSNGGGYRTTPCRLSTSSVSAIGSASRAPQRLLTVRALNMEL